MKKLVSLLCAVVLVLSLSAMAFADTPNAGFDPKSILDPDPEPVPEPDPIPEIYTVDGFICMVDEYVAELRAACDKGEYLAISAEQGFMRFFVDPNGERDSAGLLPIVRIDVFPEAGVTSFIKSYYYLEGDVINAHYRTDDYCHGDQDFFYFAKNDANDPATVDLMLLKYRPFGSSKFNVITPNDAGFAEIQTNVLAENDILVAKATTRLQALHNLGLY